MHCIQVAIVGSNHDVVDGIFACEFQPILFIVYLEVLITPFIIQIKTSIGQQITHPETGEILYTRLNLGHGLLLPYLNNYWWEYGSEDKRIRKNILHEQVAGEILQTIIMREFGLALGLTAPSPENYWEDSALQELNNGKNSNFPTQQDCKQIAWGYQQTSAYKDAIKERKLLEKIILPTRPTSTEEKIQKEKILTRKLKNYETMFSFLKSEIALHGTNQQYIVLYNQGIQSLTNHLKKLAGIISTENAERILALLDYYVFQEEHQWLDIPSLHIGNRTSYSKIISKAYSNNNPLMPLHNKIRHFGIDYMTKYGINSIRGINHLYIKWKCKLSM